MRKALTRSIGVYHGRKDGALRLYDRKTADLILAAVLRGEASVSSTELSGRPVFDLKNMKQRSLNSKEEEDIVIEISWSPESLKLAEAFSENPSTRRKILEMAILRITEEKSLSKVLDSMGLSSRSIRIRPNPYLGRGHVPFDNFVSSLENDTLAHLLLDAVLQLASNPSFSAIRRLKIRGLYILYHGTKHSVMDNILETGLLPSFRQAGRMQDWFGVHYTTSLDYTHSKNNILMISAHDCRGCKLLLFMVLLPTIYCGRGGVATSSVSANQLPLAELTLL
ncbi:hypothetical protein MPTK1_4g19050 [Marchantia polymorpha subsp. ruderalis]|uniref:Uncharacterized protein n=2 Tax=Marchantia polymorpha TaxID=3197 RepID=A0AAF6BBG5_MARPO|nr:hypothetical protein MARPO_0164s0005 [Marchantia polymorpha]BBN09349.1 hypothetical protein Mp_4g19050 [Marchantia polymorpha subsp. ruderalis]|eukprot:PTQ28406.1 hypothetical protein MARPO_0164s0005 [Marchantia polymorpha]